MKSLSPLHGQETFMRKRGSSGDVVQHIDECELSAEGNTLTLRRNMLNATMMDNIQF